jgi:hypothetical protein
MFEDADDGSQTHLGLTASARNAVYNSLRKVQIYASNTNQI